jgi:hypothetical protein
MREENCVPCLLLNVFLAFPRIALVLLFLFSNCLQRAYHGCFIAPARVLVLPFNSAGLDAGMESTGQPIAGIDLVILRV